MSKVTSENVKLLPVDKNTTLTDIVILDQLYKEYHKLLDDCNAKSFFTREEWINNGNYMISYYDESINKDVVVGFLSMPIRSLVNMNIDVLYITESYRNRGIATIVMTKITDLCKENSIQHLSIQIPVKRNLTWSIANHICTKFGFSTDKIAMAYQYCWGEKKNTDIIKGLPENWYLIDFVDEIEGEFLKNECILPKNNIISMIVLKNVYNTYIKDCLCSKFMEDNLIKYIKGGLGRYLRYLRYMSNDVFNYSILMKVNDNDVSAITIISYERPGEKYIKFPNAVNLESFKEMMSVLRNSNYFHNTSEISVLIKSDDKYWEYIDSQSTEIEFIKRLKTFE